MNKVMDNNQHVTDYYEALVEVYTSASQDLGIPVGHISDWALERWWDNWAPPRSSPDARLPMLVMAPTRGQAQA
jgi:hypothetical protein